MALPKVGDKAPAIRLETDSGEIFELSQQKGKRVVLFFYPKAMTSGCTVEAQGFRDEIAEFEKQDAVVVGISPDSPASQAKFRKKENLPYALLADVDHAVAEAYGVWQEKSMYGRKYMGIARTTFVIGPTGKIEHVFEKVKPAGHAAAVCHLLQ